MTVKHWKYLAIALVAANLVYWLVMPVWNWKGAVEQELGAIKQAIARAHPELVRQPVQPPPAEEESR